MQILQLKMQLYQNLNAALREREMEALRLQLETLKQSLDEKLAVQAATDAMRYSELQGLRNRLKKLLDEKERLAKQQNKKQTAAGQSQKTLKGVPSKASGVASGRSQGRAVKKANDKAITAKISKKVPSRVVKKEPKKKNGAQAKNGGCGTVKLGPFTRRDS